MRVRRFSSAVTLLLASATLLAQNDRTQFKTGVELIQLDVVVLDGKRQPVTGLTAEDFTVLDDGKPTPIRAFTPVQLATRTRATEAVWANEIPVDVVTNQIAEQEGRLVVILLDRSIPAHEASFRAKQIAVAAVEALGPNDLGAVISTQSNSVQSERVQDLTTDRTRLLRAINAGDPATGISPDAEAIMGKLDPLRDTRCLCGVCVHETITRVAEAVRETPRRRKVMFFIGTDMVWQASGPVGAYADLACETRVKDARATMFAAIDRANLTIHSIDPQGLVNLGPQSQGGATGAKGGPDNAGPNQRLRQQQQAVSDAMTSRANIKVLPDRTGGRVVAARNSPQETIAELFHETDAYYVLGIERAISTRPDGTRPVEVKVKKGGLRVVAQRFYGPLPAMTDPMTSVLPTASVPLSLSVMPLVSPQNGKPMVLTSIDTGALARADGSPTPLQISVQAVDRTGQPVASAKQTSTISAPRSANGPAPEVNVRAHLELPPGDYGIRVAVFDPATNTTASVFSDTTIPAFDEAPLSLSGVSVEAAAAGTGAPVPTTSRTFMQGSHVRAILQIYQGTRRTEPVVPVSMRVQLLDAKGVSVIDQSLPFAESAFTERRADCVVTLPLSKLSPGEYLLKLEASSGRQTSGRALRFIVR